jgi:hypothetical protein
MDGDIMIKKCLICENNFETKEGGIQRIYCQNCSVPGDGSRNLYNKQKEKAKKLLGGKCSSCGYNRIELLDFHHLDPNEKDFTISSDGRNFEKLLLEARKCILLCANCHREHHLGLMKELPKFNYIEFDKYLDFVQKEKYDYSKYCKHCGAKIYKYTDSLTCATCASKNSRKVPRPNPDILAEKIIQNGYVKTGKLYGVSDNAVRKWCKSYNMPLNKKELIIWLEKNRQSM